MFKVIMKFIIGIMLILICFPIYFFFDPLIFSFIILLITGIHLLIIKKRLNAIKVLEVILSYFLFFFVGFIGIWFFTGHLFLADYVSKKIGWPIGSPFQTEVGFAALAIGILGFICIWFKKEFWLATAVGNAAFFFGAAYTHIKDIIINNNLSVLNTGYLLWLNDIAIPLIVLILSIIYYVLINKKLVTDVTYEA